MTRSTLHSLAAATAMALSLTALPAQAEGNGVIDEHASEWAATIDFEANATAREAVMDEADFFRAFMVEYNETWSPGATSRFDIDVPARFYQQTERLFAFDVFPPAEGFQGWDAYAEELTAIVARSSEFNVDMREDTFRYARNGDVAWMSASIDVDGKTTDGTPYAMQARQTVVLEKIGDRWLVAHEHISAPFIPGDASASEPTSLETEEAAVRIEIIERTRAAVDVWSVGTGRFDIAAAAGFYATTPNLFAFDVVAVDDEANGVRGWEEYERALQDVMDAYQSFTVSPVEVANVGIDGETAWTATLVQMDGVMAHGTPITGKQRVTHVWRLLDGEWKIVQEHVSAPFAAAE